jgi:hypothetical protein
MPEMPAPTTRTSTVCVVGPLAVPFGVPFIVKQRRLGIGIGVYAVQREWLKIGGCWFFKCRRSGSRDPEGWVRPGHGACRVASRDYRAWGVLLRTRLLPFLIGTMSQSYAASYEVQDSASAWWHYGGMNSPLIGGEADLLTGVLGSPATRSRSCL